MSECKFKEGGSRKYVLTENYVDVLGFCPPHTIDNDYCHFHVYGLLLIRAGYEWDGPSGPAIDTDNFMDGSLVHDLLYELLRDEYLRPRWKFRLKADNEMFRQCKKDNMSLPRRIWCWLGVRIGGYFSAR